ncbi:hypothetical protein L211DRAFT_854032 [Terfezia boudieri ATCC MYA-4762]|uniref:Major facilitator superfamily (MFS) profile domain-containing protein n=1 Tax=Terfezia boudieri ATCC MYA-4762 TaxID=1051890 RepID=A0A3N4LKP8_9PEZI|nr:hypothetical protein L211DRAFT_854032 [Terfezia boudieri ATCC MYA-4762]
MTDFFNYFVNPIGLAKNGWKYYLTYVCWLAFEICFIFFMFPETSGRTLEELSIHKKNEQVKASTEMKTLAAEGTYTIGGKGDVELVEGAKHHGISTLHGSFVTIFLGPVSTSGVLFNWNVNFTIPVYDSSFEIRVEVGNKK